MLFHNVSFFWLLEFRVNKINLRSIFNGKTYRVFYIIGIGALGKILVRLYFGFLLPTVIMFIKYTVLFLLISTLFVSQSKIDLLRLLFRDVLELIKGLFSLLLKLPSCRLVCRFFNIEFKFLLIELIEKS